MWDTDKEINGSRPEFLPICTAAAESIYKQNVSQYQLPVHLRDVFTLLEVSLSSVKANLALNAKALLCYWSHKQSASQDLTKAEPQVSSKPRLTSLKVNEFVNLYKLGSAQVKVSNLVFEETSQMSPATIQSHCFVFGTYAAWNLKSSSNYFSKLLLRS